MGAASQRFCRYWRNSGHPQQTLKTTRLTHLDGLPPSFDALRKAYSMTSSARASSVGGISSGGFPGAIQMAGPGMKMDSTAWGSSRMWQKIKPLLAKVSGKCKGYYE
jgi:hypothetical protein